MSTKRGISLHIGLNSVDPTHYGGWPGPLNACEADAEDMHTIAREAGYDCRVLTTAQATRDAVITGIRAAAAELRAGDIFLLTYSGHGGQVPDRNGDEQDLLDETWCLFDGQLVDDELNVLWGGFAAGVRVLMLSDSCHSGTASRGPVGVTVPDYLTTGPVAEMLGTVGAVCRFMPDAAAARTYRNNRAFYDSIQQNTPAEAPDVSATVRLISGCQDNQVSLDGTFNGLFTSQLLRIWSAGRFTGNYGEFHSQILGRMPASQSPNHLVFGAPNPGFDQEKPFTI